MLDRSQFLKEVKNKDPHLGMLLDGIFDQIDTAFNHLGVSTKGLVTPPTPLQALNIAAGSDHVHVTLTDNSQVSKNIEYFLEYATEPTFANPHVEHLGASRGKVLPLPAKTGLGVTQNYYFRAYSQYAGSNPQTKKIYYGTLGSPTAVTLSGSSSLTLLPSTGSGTGAADGSQGGSGLGVVLQRPAPGPKRSAAPKVT